MRSDLSRIRPEVMRVWELGGSATSTSETSRVRLRALTGRRGGCDSPPAAPGRSARAQPRGSSWLRGGGAPAPLLGITTRRLRHGWGFMAASSRSHSRTPSSLWPQHQPGPRSSLRRRSCCLDNRTVYSFLSYLLSSLSFELHLAAVLIMALITKVNN